MNFVIPMAGKGTRFKRAGFEQPKYLIPVRDKILLEWSLSSLPLQLATRIIFVGLLEDENKYQISNHVNNMDMIDKKLTSYLWLSDQTGGQAETVLRAESYMDVDKPLVIFNIDTYFKSDTLADNLANDTDTGLLGSFNSDSRNYSYASLDSDGFVKEVREKQVISCHALTGLYHFAKASHFISVADEMISLGAKEQGEYYIAPLYNKLIQEGFKYKVDVCNEYAILGTPEELEHFKERGVMVNEQDHLPV